LVSGCDVVDDDASRLCSDWPAAALLAGVGSTAGLADEPLDAALGFAAPFVDAVLGAELEAAFGCDSEAAFGCDTEAAFGWDSEAAFGWDFASVDPLPSVA
jgi:hypothetical protein